MPIEVLMPALSPTMTEGKLARWLKQEGDAIRSGDVLAEIETDKATMEVEALDDGTLGRIVIAGGTDGVAVNSLIALILPEGEDPSGLASYTAGPAPSQATPAAPAVSPPSGGGNGALAAASPVAAAPAAGGPPAPQGRILASPLARRIARSQNIDLARIRGTGPNGRIVRADVEAAASQPGPAPSPGLPAPATATAPASGAAPGADSPELGFMAAQMPHRLEPHTNMRRTIARRLGESKQQAPHIYLTVTCRMDELVRLRGQLKERLAEGQAFSINDMLIKASALALRTVPEANVSWSGQGMYFWEEAHISVAVATPAGLITPVIRHADRKGLATIGAEMREMAGRAREGKLKPEEYQGGCFTLSNLGMFGVEEFSAILNPPQAGILAIGSAVQQPVVREGAVAIASCMKVTLSVDHRAVDGAVAARWLAAFRGLVEDPLGMML